jgi:TonB-linked SusC/RagA family outer membrane protein
MRKILYLMRCCYKKDNYLLKVGAAISFILILMALPTFNTYGSNPPSSVTAQQIKVTGTVIGAKDKISIPGVSVLEKGTTNGVITDVNGNFTLTVQSPKAVLVFSFIGYVAEEKAINGQSVINVSLKEDIKQIEDVVVVGYGTVKKSDISGAVVSVNAKEMMKKMPTNIVQGLKGDAAGVVVSAQDGSPDANSSIQIRGVATINGNTKPLYVIDGVVVGSDANFLNPSDIESIEILKDASSTAIYGAAGANGVIMVTTKHGAVGTAHITVSVDYGLQDLASRLDVGNVDQYAKNIRQARLNDGNGTNLSNQIFAAKYDGQRKNIDWQKAMTRVALRQQYSVSSQGGSEKTQQFFSVSYLNHDGIVINSNAKRLTARASVVSKVADFLEIGGDINFIHSESWVTMQVSVIMVTFLLSVTGLSHVLRWII